MGTERSGRNNIYLFKQLYSEILIFPTSKGKKNKFEKLGSLQEIGGLKITNEWRETTSGSNNRKLQKNLAGYSKKRGSTVNYITCILKFQL